MITYIEKGINLHRLIYSSGYFLIQQDNEWISSDDIEVQLIIDSYDPLSDDQDEAKDRVKKVAAEKVSIIYPFINADSTEAISFYNLVEDLYLSTIPAARETLSGNLLTLKNIHDAAVDAIAYIESMTDVSLVQAYDAVNTPSWP